MEEVNREMRQFGVAVPGGVEHVGLRGRMLHETGNWLVLADCSNSFITVKRTAELEEVANGVLVLTPLVAECYGTRPADVFFRIDSSGHQDDRLLQRCPARAPHGTSNVLPGVVTGAEVIPAGIREREGVEAFVYVADVSLGLTGSRPTRLEHSPSSAES